MEQDRRTFLQTAVTGAAAIAGVAAVPTETSAQNVQLRATRVAEPKDLPKGFTFATLRRPDGFGLGVRTDRGILDVIAAEKDFSERAPTTITAVFKGEGDVAGLRRLADRAKASSDAARYFV